MAGFPQEWLEELKSKSNIIDVIGRYVPLTRKGRSFWGCCPFHHEKTPSFTADEGKQFYYCFGCKASGNVITFIEKIENVDFLDAIKHLAEKAGMRLPELKNISDGDIAAAKERRDQIHKTLKAAALYYHENLSKPGGKQALDYLEQRGVTSGSIKRFGLGASVNWDNLITYMLSQGFTHEQLRQAGLAECKDGRWYDVFGGRLMFPVINNWLNVVGFSGRLLDKEAKMAKYRNSAQTAVFDKSKLLYGINLLRQKKQKDGVPHIIIVEGQMDVISLHQAGFDTAVACLGTALTAAHARLIKNYCGKVYLCYDGDTAGQAATLRGLDILAESGLEIRVMSLPDKLDPDDLIRKHGAEAFEECIRRAKTLLEFKLDTTKSAYNMNDASQKAKYAVDAVKIIKSLVNPVEQEEYLKKVKDDTGYTLDSLKKQVQSAEEQPLKIIETFISKSGEDKRVAFILHSQLMNEKYSDDFDLSEFIDGELYKTINKYIRATKLKDGIPNPGVLYDFIGTELQQQLGDFLNTTFEMDFEASTNFYDKSKKSLLYEKLLHRKSEISIQYDNEKQIDERRKLSLELSKILNEEQRYRKELIRN